MLSLNSGKIDPFRSSSIVDPFVNYRKENVLLKITTENFRTNFARKKSCSRALLCGD